MTSHIASRFAADVAATSRGENVVAEQACADLDMRVAGIADLEAVRSMHERCSTQSLFRRHHTDLLDLPDRVLTALLPPTDGVSLGARAGSQVVGMAAVAALPGSLAAERGFTRLVATTHLDNDGVLPTFRRAGLVPRLRRCDGVAEISCPLTGLAPTVMPRVKSGWERVS